MFAFTFVLLLTALHVSNECHPFFETLMQMALPGVTQLFNPTPQQPAAIPFNFLSRGAQHSAGRWIRRKADDPDVTESAAMRIRQTAREKIGVDSVKKYNVAIFGEEQARRDIVAQMTTSDGIVAAIEQTSMTGGKESDVHSFVMRQFPNIVLWDVTCRSETSRLANRCFLENMLFLFDCAVIATTTVFTEADFLIASQARLSNVPVVFLRLIGIDEVLTFTQKEQIREFLLAQMARSDFTDTKLFVAYTNTLGNIYVAGSEEVALADHIARTVYKRRNS